MSPQYGIDKVSLGKGYWFYFDDNGTPITAFGSAVSGREKVFVDDELVSSKRNWRFSTHHDFTWNDTPYRVEFKVTDWRTGELTCSLSKDGTLVSTATKAYATSEKAAFSWRSLLLSVLYGGIFGFAVVWGFYQGKSFFGG